MTEGQAPVLQPIRANVSHFKKPWFDSVQVRRLGPRGESETAYAELRLLFEADVSTAGEDGVGLESKPEVMYCKLRILLFNSIHSILHVTHTHTHTHTHTLAGAAYSATQYAFVRWYKKAPVYGDLLEAAGSVRVIYDSATRKSIHGLYEVIPLSSIVCRHHVVPTFCEKGSFYVSCLSPLRPV